MQMESYEREHYSGAITVLLSIFGQYVADVRTVQKLLQEAEETIDYINKEEAFYKWDPTFYPEVEVIKESIEPYQKLFGLVLNWQRTENRSDFSLMRVLCFNYKICPNNLLSSLCIDGWMVPSRT